MVVVNNFHCRRMIELSTNTCEYADRDMARDELMNVDENKKVDDEMYIEEEIFVLDEDVKVNYMNNCNDIVA